ncbi:MAG TPA: hypothetical protein VLF14_09040 [Candidatus Binatia bacterium]|nr:hypothetical protein [Candidatus Binatia bacterium]
MKVNQLVGPVVAAGLLMVSSIAFATPPSCDPAAVADAKAAIDVACPCDGLPGDSGTVPWKNHGQYVRCVTKAKKTVASSAGVARQCLNRVVPCAANSTCGKASAVACQVTTGACVGGTCDNDPEKSCTDNSECSQSSCFVADSEQVCADSLGTATVGSCCQ